MIERLRTIKRILKPGVFDDTFHRDLIFPKLLIISQEPLFIYGNAYSVLRKIAILAELFKRRMRELTITEVASTRKSGRTQHCPCMLKLFMVLDLASPTSR